MHFFSLPTTVPPGPVARSSGLIPNGSRAHSSSPVWVSHSANANMPRNRVSTSVPQKWKPATIASPSPSV